ncbi:MAG: DUF503 domain-containing protein [Ktedonobacterales bacterium]|nr:DUF503 domain-containing protein [Ktedonobacterales bacterium]
MMIGALRIVLRLPESHSLKDKRQIVKSLLARARHDYAVAAAETGEQDRWQIAELGFAYVSASGAHATEVLEKVARFIDTTRPDLDILEEHIEALELGAD